MSHFRKLIGLAGVSKNENHHAKLWSRRLEQILVIFAIWMPLQWYMQLHHTVPYLIAIIINLIIWSFFVVETILLIALVHQKINYIKYNWMNLIIILVGIPIISHKIIFEKPFMSSLLHTLQILFMFRLLLPWWDTCVQMLSRNRLGTTLFITFLTTTMAGILMVVIEPAIYKTPWEGIWWAWETVTTVGYGDMVPVTLEGRVLGVFLMLMGVAFLSLLTANFAAYFISKGTAHVEKTEDKILSTLNNINQRLDKIETQIKQQKNKHFS